MLRSSIQTLAALAFLLAVPSPSWASGATFEIRATGIKLGEPKEAFEEGKDLIRISAKTQVGKPFTLTAQGMVLPRAGKPEPTEPDSGAWTFDEKAAKKLKPEIKADPTIIAVAVEPTTPGTLRFQFEGKVLGYPKIFVVVVEVEK